MVSTDGKAIAASRDGYGTSEVTRGTSQVGNAALGGGSGRRNRLRPIGARDLWVLGKSFRGKACPASSLGTDRQSG
jgi:hypothetical protein